MSNEENRQTEIIMQKINEFEEKICEIKENTTVFIPEEIKIIFPLITHINIFSLIKKIEMYKKLLIIQYRDVKNEIRYIQYKREMNTSSGSSSSGTSTDTYYLHERKHTDKNILITTENSKESSHSTGHKTHLETLISTKNKIREEIIDYKNAYYKIDQAFMNEIRKAETSRPFFIQFMFFFGIVIPSDERDSPIHKYIS